MVWGLYKDALSRHPLLTKATTASILMSVSDILCQELEEHLLPPLEEKSAGLDDWATNSTAESVFPKHDWERTLHVGITGFTFSGPITHFWYQLLERFVALLGVENCSDEGVGAATTVLLCKLVLDALVFSPLAVAGYFCWRSVLEHKIGHRFSNIPTKLKEKWASALVASWSFWPLANIFNFSFVPLEYRVLYNNSLSIIWNAYLSNVNSRPTTKNCKVSDDTLGEND